jgi:hypothetical protein
MQCRDAAGDVHLRHDPSAEYIAGIVAITGHGDDAQSRFALRQGGVLMIIQD